MCKPYCGQFESSTITSCIGELHYSKFASDYMNYQEDGGVASFVVHSTGSSVRYQECVFTACSAETDDGCELAQKCYITIPLRQGAFNWFGQLIIHH